MPAAEAYGALQSFHRGAADSAFDLDLHLLKAVGRYINSEEGIRVSTACDSVWTNCRTELDELFAKLAAEHKPDRSRTGPCAQVSCDQQLGKVGIWPAWNCTHSGLDPGRHEQQTQGLP